MTCLYIIQVTIYRYVSTIGMDKAGIAPFMWFFSLPRWCFCLENSKPPVLKGPGRYILQHCAFTDSEIIAGLWSLHELILIIWYPLK